MRRINTVPLRALFISITTGALITSATAGTDPFADEVINYDPGDNPAMNFENAETALGEPERFTGELAGFAGAVTMFNSPFGTDEIVSIGANGELIVRFDEPVVDDPRNPFGIDLIVFSNAFFLDNDFPNGIVGGVAAEGGNIEVSADGENWFMVAENAADGLFPTQGWVDVPAQSTMAGEIPCLMTRPVDPAITIDDLLGVNYDDVLAMYNHSGGGFGVDISPSGLASIQYVRITNPGDPKLTVSVEIDAFADVTAVGDINNDGEVGGQDLLALLAGWGPLSSSNVAADFNADGVINGSDLLALLNNWE